MEAVMYLQETLSITDVIESIRSELTNAVRTALVNHAYDTDIQLSFGAIHINSKGSVSQISFGGSDVTDMDAFVVQQALKISEDNYFDLRQSIKEKPADFRFYPILINGQLSFTVLKSSPYFERKYGYGIHQDGVRVEYASKYLILYRNGSAVPDVYLIGLFGAEATANLLLMKAGKTFSGKSMIYYCFMNSRPEVFLHLGQVKSDFEQYHPEKYTELYNFYKGTVISGIFKINKKTDANGKVKQKETLRKCMKMIIEMQYGSITEFCAVNDINPQSLTAFLAGASSNVLYQNGNTLSPTRLTEILNIPFDPDAEGLKDRNLLVKVDYEEIPS